MRASTRFCASLCGNGIYSPLETCRVGTGEQNSSASSARLHSASSSSLSHESSSRCASRKVNVFLSVIVKPPSLRNKRVVGQIVSTQSGGRRALGRATPLTMHSSAARTSNAVSRLVYLVATVAECSDGTQGTNRRFSKFYEIYHFHPVTYPRLTSPSPPFALRCSHLVSASFRTRFPFVALLVHLFTSQ